MKYIAILALVFIVMRIDFFLGLIDKVAQKAEPTPVEVNPADISSDRETIPLTNDLSFKSTPKKSFLAYLEDFHINPMAPIRERAMELLKKNPLLFDLKVLDKDLESHIFRWRDLLINNDQETMIFLTDLMNHLQGENQKMIRRFFSLLMDINMENFLAAYSKSNDTNCSIGTTIGDSLPEEEVRNEIYDRESSLKNFLAKEKIDPKEKALATNCLLVIGLEISKFPPPPRVEETNSSESP